MRYLLEDFSRRVIDFDLAEEILWVSANQDIRRYMMQCSTMDE